MTEDEGLAPKRRCIMIFSPMKLCDSKKLCIFAIEMLVV